MRKSFEAEHQLKLAIRDIVVRNPLTSVHQLRRDLAERGFKTANGNPLDWYYVAKVVRKLNRANALAVRKVSRSQARISPTTTTPSNGPGTVEQFRKLWRRQVGMETGKSNRASVQGRLFK